MFDRQFFEVDLFKLIAHYAATHETDGPVVELRLTDGSSLRLKAKVVATDNWATFEVHEDPNGRRDAQVTIPYELVAQVLVYPTDPSEPHIGFRRD
ncbi:MAG: hypothetical protein IRZ11_07995 [Clostridia bacterium]|nr:hypothetical protein [Clostridia bacterium]